MSQKKSQKSPKTAGAKTDKNGATATSPRRFKTKESSYKSFRLSKRIKHATPKLPGTLRLIRSALAHVRQYKLVWFSVLGVFALVQIVLVQGVLGGNIGEFSDMVTVMYDDLSEGLTNLALLSYVITTTGQASTEGGAVYQILLVLLTSLALIWVLRQTMAGVQVGLRDAFYKGMYPLIPFVLVLLVICLQLIPLLFGAWLYQVIVGAGIAVNAVEQLFWLVIAGLFALLTLYMLCSSLFAAYIVTLPDMTPMRALRSARGLVRHRRLSVFWRIIAFLLLLVIAGAIILVPVIFVIPVAATWIFYLLGVLGIGLFHTYMYGLYRELLNDA